MTFLREWFILVQVGRFVIFVQLEEKTCMTTTTISKAREDLAEIVNRVAYKGERVVIRRRGKNLAALIPVEDLATLEALEDRLDAEAAKKALAESKERIPYAKVRKELGLK